MTFTSVAYGSTNGGVNAFSANPAWNCPAPVAGNILAMGVWVDGAATPQPGSGWTLATSGNVATGRIFLYWRTADGSSADSAQVSFSGNSNSVVAVYEEWSGITGYDTANLGTSVGTQASKSVTLNTQGSGRLTWWFGGVYGGGVSFQSGPVTNVTEDRTVRSTMSYVVGDGVSATSPTTETLALSGPDYTFLSGLAFYANQSPNAPILATPTNGTAIDRNSTQRFDWNPSDPDPGDSQSKYDLHYRITGTSTWTTVSASVPHTFHDFAAGTFAAGDYEWQVRTYDAQGAVGPWSSSSFFTAADAPASPTITTPVNGGTFAQTQPVEWSTPVQDAYQIQVRDTGDTVLYDSGEVVTTTARSTTVPFPDNGTTRKLRLRVKDGGLWSPWYEITGTVSWLAPPAPVVSLLPDGDSGALLVTVTNPAPTGAEPAAAYSRIRVNDGDGLDYKDGSRMVAVNSTWTYHLPVIGRDYEGNVEVTAVADNGVTATTTA